MIASPATPYVTASELAAMRLPGRPTTSRGWNLLRSANNWPVAERHGPRGVELWLASELPADLRVAIEDWREAASAKVVAAPAGARGRPKGTGWFDRHPEQAEAVLSYIASHKHGAPTVLRLLATQFADVPELHTLRRYIRELERTRPATLLRQRDPDASKNRHQIALGRADGGVDRAHQVWELDTTKADVMLIGGRQMVLGMIDRYSRRVRFLVAPSESGQSVRRLLIGTIGAWGVMPETVVTDNGSGYVNASIVSALAILGIEHQPCLPGTPERKPFVERMFANFMHHRAPLLPGFTGKNVAEAQRLRAREKKRTGRAEILGTLTAEELQHYLDLWVDGHYHLAIHSGTGQAPLARCLASPTPAIAAPPAAVLERALSALVGPRLVGKKGVEWRGGSYWCPALAAWMGRQVIARRDEDDLGALLIFDEDQHYIGCAVNFERAGLSERDYAIAARNHQRTHQKAEAAQLRAVARRYPIERAAQDLMRAEAEAAGKLAVLPPRTIERSNSRIASFADDAPILPSETQLAHAEARLPTPRSAELPVEQKVAAADAAVAAAAAGQDVPAADLAAAHAYRASVEYRATRLWMGTGPAVPSTTSHQEKTA